MESNTDASTMTFDEVMHRTRMTVGNFLNVGFDEATPEAHIQGDLGADSLDIIEVVMALEEEFGIGISDEEAENIRTVDDAAKVIAKQCGVEYVHTVSA